MTMENNWPYAKIVKVEDLPALSKKLKAGGEIVVSMNGSFDILHAGHLYFLKEAKAQGSALVVAVNSDASVRQAKGASRPYISEKDRAAMVAAMEVVDFVVVIDAPYADMPSVFIRALQPDVHVNGSEYGPVETWVEYPAMQEVGASGYQVQRQAGLATTDLIKKIKESA
jgi:rfaE bifunctional protein nucleotidyltransferase chain/domain